MTDEWLTYYEKSGCLATPVYAESIAYFQKLAAASRFLQIKEYGETASGRPLYAVIAATNNAFTPKQAHRQGKAVIFIQNGIHAGEIAGKDAWMLLLREILIRKTRPGFLDHVVLVIIPAVNPDGHERRSPYNRPNQIGPTETGWRTTAHNLNLNRDYMKADAPEMRALLHLFHQWKPDFMIDNHTTNGADYQYHISYSLEFHPNIDQALGKWGKYELMPRVIRTLEEKGFETAPYLESKTDDLKDGIAIEPGLPRYSTGYAAVQNRLGLLVETHSLKTYKNRVESTFAMNESVITLIGANAAGLKQMNREADEAAIREYSVKKKKYTLNYKMTDAYEIMMFKGYKTNKVWSDALGMEVVLYTKEPEVFPMPIFAAPVPSKTVSVPAAYCIPPYLKHIVKLLKLHGITVLPCRTEAEVPVTRYRFTDTRPALFPYEGRMRLEVDTEVVAATMTPGPGWFIVPTRQKGVRCIMQLLEPEGKDSLVSWGFFNAYIERKEYAEKYVMEPLIKKMLDEDQELRAEFEDLLRNDPCMRSDPMKRLEYFYRRSPFFDPNENVYPIVMIRDRKDLKKLV